jgi:prepilin-type N-terminal cleavage/methylation domain-containing protein
MKVQRPSGKVESCGGFSLTELVVTMAVALVLMGIGMPSFLRAYHTYQLTNAAQQMADILRFTRYEAIRLNTGLSCQIQPSAAGPTMTSVWTDSNKNGVLDATEKQILLGGGGNLVAAGGVPGVTVLIAAAQVTTGTVMPAPNGTAIAFDSRGAVNPESVYVFYLASAAAPEAGYRAVLLMPTGSIQVWTGDTNGNWHQLR